MSLVPEGRGSVKSGYGREGMGECMNERSEMTTLLQRVRRTPSSVTAPD